MDLWTEKYRPKTLDEYVWKDAKSRAQVEGWLRQGALPHLLLSGVQGSGKTSLAKLLFRELKVASGDILEINASRERSPDIVASKILNFCTTMSFGGGMKYILLDEADSMTPLAQRILRGEMENYHETVRFVLTCNYKNKIIPALNSRCQGFHFQELDMGEFMTRIVDILTSEGVILETEEDLTAMQGYLEATHPDMRKCINLLQQNVVDGKLAPLHDEGEKLDWLEGAVDLFKAGRFAEARTMIVTKAQAEEYESVYRFFYENLSIWGGNDEDKQIQALLVIRSGLVNHGLVADVEINLAATIAELVLISKS